MIAMAATFKPKSKTTAFFKTGHGESNYFVHGYTAIFFIHGRFFSF
jgi:hypothetical protein